MRIYRWDLDKTYLQTDFESLRGLVRSATEPAGAKRAVPGATELVQALSGGRLSQVHIVSGSPEQLRPKLEAKLAMDGVEYASLTLKDTWGHMRRGEIRMIRGQFGYKLPTLLKARRGMGSGARETLFGDDAEIDALVYSVYADAVAGRLSAPELARIMEAAGAYPEAIESARTALDRLGTSEAVERIFIRLEKGVPPQRFASLGARVVPVHSWFQAALVLFELGHISAQSAARVRDAVIRDGGRDAWAVGALCQDLVRRGHVGAGTVGALAGPPDLVRACTEAVKRVGPAVAVGPADADAVPDYVALVRAWGD